MRQFAYTFCVVRYLHDPAVGETLNVGVILCSPIVPFVGGRFDQHYERLSGTFAGFEGEHYKVAIRSVERALNQLSDELRDRLFEVPDALNDAAALGAWLFPDKDLSFQIGPVLAGITDDPDQALDSIFTRMVTSQYPHRHNDGRSDADVWSVYQHPLIHRKANRVLEPTRITTKDIELEFEHAFRNEHWNLLQPLSMDYVKKDTIQRKAATWLGNAMAIQGHRNLGKLYILLGAPTLQIHKETYQRAKNLLHKMPIKHELVEEDEAERFAEQLVEDMRAHGLLKDN